MEDNSFRNFDAIPRKCQRRKHDKLPSGCTPISGYLSAWNKPHDYDILTNDNSIGQVGMDNKRTNRRTSRRQLSMTNLSKAIRTKTQFRSEQPRTEMKTTESHNFRTKVHESKLRQSRIPELQKCPSQLNKSKLRTAQTKLDDRKLVTRYSSKNIIECSRMFGRMKLVHTRKRITRTMLSMNDVMARDTVGEVIGALRGGGVGALCSGEVGGGCDATARVARYRKRIERRKALCVRFRKRVRFFILLTRTWKIHKNRLTLTLPSYGPLQNTTPSDKKKQLLFDITAFRANKEIMKPLSLACLQEPCRRVVDNRHICLENSHNPCTSFAIFIPNRYNAGWPYILQIQVALRNYKTVSQYPMGIQRLLAARAWIETYNEKRIIVREGHVPMCFYLILSGSALLTRPVDDVITRPQHGPAATKVSIMKRGEVFEEGCLMHGTRRTGTVISRDRIELLCVNDRDFVSIFMSGGLTDRELPFLRPLWFLKHWPVDEMLHHKTKATFSYFTPGKVLVENSEKNDWIYIVKSGSCKVLMKLTKNNKTQHQITPDHDTKTEEDRGSKPEMEDAVKTVKPRLLPEINVATDAQYRQLLNEQKQARIPKKKEGNPIKDDEPAKTRLPTLHPSTKGPFLSRTGTSTSLVSIPEPADGDNAPDGTMEPDIRDITEPTNDTFVVVNVLSKGQAFGLHDVMHESGETLSLVSNGAECVMVDKRFYMDHVTDDLRHELETQLCSYPSSDQVRNKLKRHVLWNNFRQQTLRHSMEAIHNRRVNAYRRLPAIGASL